MPIKHRAFRGAVFGLMWGGEAQSVALYMLNQAGLNETVRLSAFTFYKTDVELTPCPGSICLTIIEVTDKPNF